MRSTRIFSVVALTVALPACGGSSNGTLNIQGIFTAPLAERTLPLG